MHQQAGRGAGGAPVSRNGGGRLVGGALEGTAAVGWSVSERGGAEAGPTSGPAAPASTPQPSLFTIYCDNRLSTDPEESWGAGPFPLSSTHFGLLQRARLLLSSTGWAVRLPFFLLGY